LDPQRKELWKGKVFTEGGVGVSVVGYSVLLLTNKRCEFILHFFVSQSCNSETKIHYYNDEVRYMVTILEIWISRGVFILIDAELGANEKV